MHIWIGLLFPPVLGSDQMRSHMTGWATGVVIALMASAAVAGGLPSQLAETVGGDPEASTPECQAAVADANAWNERKAQGALGKVGRFIIWPLGEGKARRKSEAKNAARELVMERLRQACFTQPVINRAEAPRGQRWPGGEGYDKKLAFVARTGGRKVLAVIHPSIDTMWVQASNGGRGYVYWTPDAFVGPVSWALEPTGCRVTQDNPAANGGREVAFVCPPGVNLRRSVIGRDEDREDKLDPLEH